MDLESINMFFGKICKKLCLVPWLNLPKLPESKYPARKSAYTVRYGTHILYGTAPYGTIPVPYVMYRTVRTVRHNRLRIKFSACREEAAVRPFHLQMCSTGLHLRAAQRTAG